MRIDLQKEADNKSSVDFMSKINEKINSIATRLSKKNNKMHLLNKIVHG